MSSDNRDKTVFKQASENPDRTVIRPAPGRRNTARSPQAGPDNNAPVAPAASQPGQPQFDAHNQPQQQPQYQNDPAQGIAYGGFQGGLNPLVSAASTLIAVFEKTRQAMSHPDVGGLHQRLAGEIRQFEEKARQIGLQPEVILAARYCICTALDEAVLNTPWGSESGWPQRTLLSVFHNETSGGVKFFEILDRMMQYPADNTDFLEFMYILLSLGFEGKYRVIDRGRDLIEQLRDELFASIRRQRGEYERSLSPSWQGLGKTRNSLTSYIPLWVVASILGAVLLLSYSGFRIWLFDSSSPVVAQLDEIVEMKGNLGKKSQSESDNQ